MNIRLIQIKGRNFKGLRSFEARVDGQNAVIKGKNGSGKTTVADMLYWNLFDKNTAGAKDFDLHPLDADNKVIEGLVVSVECILSIDGKEHVFLKESHERNVKGQIRGYETLCYIDQVPKKVSEYQNYIDELIPSDTFKMLTSIRHFNEGIKWPERRKMLLEIAGKIGTPEGFDTLIENLNGRTIEEYKKVLADQKKRLEKDRDEINPRIDEIQRSLEAYAETDTSDIEKQRKEVQSSLRILQVKRITLTASEKERNQKLEFINGLKSDLAERERELLSDTSGIQKLLDEKAEIEAKVSKHKQQVAEAMDAEVMKAYEIKNKQTEIKRLLDQLDNVRSEYKEAESEKGEENCYACGQTLPADKLKANAEKKQAKLTEIMERGNKLKKSLDDCKAVLLTLETELKALHQNLDKLNGQVAERDAYKAKRFNEIDIAIAANKTTSPTADKLWNEISLRITNCEKELGPKISEQVDKIDKELETKNEELKKINETLAQSDNIKKAKIRIDELKKQEKELSRKIADREKELDEIGRYQASVSALIESSVNGKFKHVTLKLFETLLNGSIDDTCVAMFNGVPYSDCSYGQKIIMGIDVINVLSAHYGYSVPLFIDNSESLTLPIETNHQTIKLFATEVPGLQFTKEESAQPESQEELFPKPSKTTKRTNKKVKETV